ncbi:hypothetical protein MMC25_001086 [Agyrium rufum]|nr:hypothetical protein [Agyrium rufum]
MDPKTVSNEVVLAILDGLISLTSQTNDQQQANYGYILRSIKTSFALCQTPSNATEAVEWNKVLLRLCELFQSDLATTPGSVMTSLNPHHSTKNKYAGITHLPDGASAQFGLLTLVLQAFIDLGYQRAALKTFQLMQEIFHGNCLKASGNFRKLARPESNDEATMRDPDISDCSTSLQLQIPDHTLAAFIDYTTSLGLFEIPESLLFSRDTDAPFIQPARYSSSILQPALLRYAAARHDGTFLAQVATYIRIPMSNENLHALLQCQIALDQWDGVYSILDNMKDEGLVVSAAEVALIAKSVFLSRHRQNRFKSGGGRRSQSDRILEDVLQGSYDARPAASGKRDYSRIRLLNQLARMISSMNPQMERLMRPYVQHQGTLHTPVLVPADAFEVLLGAIVEADGPYAGQSFWQQWCLSPSSKSNDPLILDGTEKVIIPRLQGVVAATRPLANGEDPSVTLRLKGTNERARQLESQKYTRLCQFLRWAVTLYRQFGYSEAMVALEIRRCLPGLTPPQQHDLVNRILATE